MSRASRHFAELTQILLAAASLFFWAAAVRGADPARWTLQLDLDGVRLEGTPLAWTESQVNLLARDGRLWSFEPKAAHNPRKSSSTFSAYSSGEMRQRLAAEMGQAFDETGTGHYLVVHPKGQGTYWSQRFEELYRSFVQYFSVRGLNVKEPEFPLVAVIWPNQADFQRAARNDGIVLPAGVLGYYSPRTNRISMFDLGGGSASQRLWQENSATVVHEATHQVAFNTGVHRRFAGAPRWIVEGLGTMFEARGVWNSREFTNRADRINKGRFAAFRDYVATRRKVGSLADTISSDRQFDTDIDGAYAEAWAFTFYLVETQPQRYAEYLTRTAARPAFSDYPGPERVRDFQKVFGDDVRMLEAHFLRYMSELSDR